MKTIGSLSNQVTGDIDCYGVEVSGADDDGGWWGTPNAWIVFGDEDTSGCDERGEPDGSCDGPDHDPKTPTLFKVSGRGWCGEDVSGYFIASSEEELVRHIRGFGPVEPQIEKGHRLPFKVRVGQVWHVTDSGMQELEQKLEDKKYRR